MQWLKFSIVSLVLTLATPIFAAKFTSEECLNSSYATSIQHKGKFFGLLENKLTLDKKKCEIAVRFKGILETTWKIDVCREPIHMKVTSKGSHDVYKRSKKCEEGMKTDYCYFRNELLESLQDHGLIFADGQREDLKDSHGQTYCAYLLISRYLDDGMIFSPFETPKNIYKEYTSCDVPTDKKGYESEESASSSEINTDSNPMTSSHEKKPLDEDQENSKKGETSEQPKF